LVGHAVECCRAALSHEDLVIVSSDDNAAWGAAWERAHQGGLRPASEALQRAADDLKQGRPAPPRVRFSLRPPELALDTTAMVDVVRYVLADYEMELGDNASDDIVLIVQPTQPFRTPRHLQRAIALLREEHAEFPDSTAPADSVVSVVEVPPTHHADVQLDLEEGWLCRYTDNPFDWGGLAARRQDLHPLYVRDGTVYAFWRTTVAQHGTIYGQHVRGLIIDPADSCELDTELQWAELEARWKARHG
jgi:CMP-N-acetylneuraminic acid synthetase